MVLPGWSCPAIQSASRLAKVPPLVRWPRWVFQPNMAARALNGFDFHLGAGAAAVESVVVGIDPHRKRVGRARNGMGRLEHLSGVERMEIGVVLSQANRRFPKHIDHGGGSRCGEG